MKNAVPLSSLSLLFCYSAMAIGNKFDSAFVNSEFVSNIYSAENIDLKTSYYGGGGGSIVHFFDGLEGGYFLPSATAPNGYSFSGSLEGTFELGIQIEISPSSSRRIGMLSISLHDRFFAMNESYNDALGNKITNRLNFNNWGLPVCYTSISDKSGVGNYWEIGVNIIAGANVQNDGNDYSHHFNSFYLEPIMSFGWTAPFELRKRGSTVGGGKILFGPYVSYAGTNMSTDPGISLHCARFGLKCAYVFMERQ